MISNTILRFAILVKPAALTRFCDYLLALATLGLIGPAAQRVGIVKPAIARR